jgi:hypothetical protein
VQEQRLARPRSGVGDAHVDSSEGANACFKRLFDLRRLRDVGVDAHGALGPALLARPLLQLAKTLRAVQHKARALARESLRQRAADSAGGAGDQDGLVGELELHRSKLLCPARLSPARATLDGARGYTLRPAIRLTSIHAHLETPVWNACSLPVGVLLR